jgi:hypothetical protein
MERWSNGLDKQWITGVLEWWSNGTGKFNQYSITPIFYTPLLLLLPAEWLKEAETPHWGCVYAL